MSKPIVMIRFDKNDLFLQNKREEILDLMRRFVQTLGHEYHVIAVPKELDILVLNGLSFDLNEKDLEELKAKLLGE
jgi:hypothetical protein